MSSKANQSRISNLKPQNHANQLYLEVQANLEMARILRSFLDIFWDSFVPSKDKEKFILAFDEAFTNAVKYGSKKSSKVRINIQGEKNYLSFRVEDEGALKKIKAKEILNNSKNLPDKLRKGQRGISILIPSLCSGFKIENNEWGGISIEAWKESEARS